MKPNFTVFTVLILALLLTACGPAAPTATPTQDPVVLAATLDSVRTQAAQTIVADMTLNAPTATEVPPTETPTNTPEPTATAFPTMTPLPPTSTFVPWTATPVYTATPSDYNCTIIEQSPSNGATFTPNAPFDGRWVIKNTGSEEWVGGDTDIRYTSGTKFQESVSTLDLSGDIDPDEEHTIIVDMLAPKDPGSYSTTWTVNYGGRIVCTMSLNIKVEK